MAELKRFLCLFGKHKWMMLDDRETEGLHCLKHCLCCEKTIWVYRWGLFIIIESEYPNLLLRRARELEEYASSL